MTTKSEKAAKAAAQTAAARKAAAAATAARKAARKAAATPADETAKAEAARAWARAALGVRTAQSAEAGSLCAMMVCAAEHGAFAPEMLTAAWEAEGGTLTEGSAKVYASQFGVGAKLSPVLGVTAAAQFVRDAFAAATGKAFPKVLTACRAVVKRAEGKPMPPATAKAAMAEALEAVKVERVPAAKAPKAPKAGADAGEPRTVVLEDVATHGELARFVQAVYAKASKMNPPAKGADLTGWRAMVKALGNAADACGTLAA